MKNQLFTWMLSILAILTVSCDKEEKKSEPSYFIKFTYNSKEYSIPNALFNNQEDASLIIGIDQNMNTLTIATDVKLQNGKTYDIYSSTPDVPSGTIFIMTLGLIGDESTFDAIVPRKIGQLTITGLTDKLMTGTFSCEMIKGEITNGTFSAKFDATLFDE